MDRERLISYSEIEGPHSRQLSASSLSGLNFNSANESLLQVTGRCNPRQGTDLYIAVDRAWRSCCFILLCAIMAPGLWAQQTFTWEQIREKFKQTNPTLLADQVTIDESRADEITAFLRPNPDLSFNLDQFTVFATPNTPYRPLTGVLESGSISY